MARAKPIRITKELYGKYLLDRMKFRLEQWVMPEPDYDDCLLQDTIEEWQAKYIFEPYDARHHKPDKCPDPIVYPSGEKFCSHPVYNLFYIQLPKKYAKTTVTGGISFDELVFARPGFEGYVLAGKKDQAGLIYNQVEGFFQRNYNFKAEVDYLCHKDKIYRLGVNKRRIASLEKMSRDAMTTSGVGPDYFIFDEFWNQPDRKLWDVVYTGTAAKRMWRGVILTNAGEDDDDHKVGEDHDHTICYEVREMCRKKEFDNYYYCELGVEPKDIPVPKWIDKKQRENKKRSLPRHIYLRWYKNKWAGKYGVAFKKKKIDIAINPELKQKFGGQGNYVLAIDVGTKRATTVAIIAHRERGIKVDSMKYWQGTQEEAVDIAEVGEWIETQADNFRILTVVADPWQMAFLIQILRKKGIEVKEFPGSESNARRLSGILRDVIEAEYLEIYSEAVELIEDLRKTEGYVKGEGWRISRKFDFSITLGMVCAELMASVDEEGGSFDYPLTHTGEKRKFGDLENLDFSDWKKKTKIETEDETGIPYWRSFE